MTPSPLPLPARLRLGLRRLAVALAAVASVATLAPVDTASAQNVELAVNALAPQVTASAGEAVDALDRFAVTGAVEDERSLAWHRAITARYTARQLGYDELAMVDAWSSAPLGHQRAVLTALTQLGVPYRTNTSSEGEGFDCSGLTTYAWRGSGVDLYRQSGTQISNAASVSKDEAQPGDLVHYPGHVMLYLGVDDAIVHSPQTGRTVEIDTVSSRRSVRFGDPTR